MDRRRFVKQALWAGGGLASLPFLDACGGSTDQVSPRNAYRQANLAASSAAYDPTFLIPDMIDAWGIAIRPAGAGGHFWITASSASYEFVGDVNGAPIALDPDLIAVTLPPSGDNPGAANGIVFNSTGVGFDITQTLPSGQAFTASSKFVFVSDNACLSAWTQFANADGSLEYPDYALKILDDGPNGSAFFGLAASPGFDKLFVADFGNNPYPRVRIFDDTFTEEEVAGRFANPFTTPGTFVPGDYAPWNIHTQQINGGYSVFIAYVPTSEDPDNPGSVLFATENTGRGSSRLVEYTPAGDLVAIWDDRGTLNGNWGMALAPSNFGPFSNQLLVGNFSDGTIVGFDTTKKAATEFLRDDSGNVAVIQGLWGMLFGNGVKLGDTNALYFAAGPADETEGLFGSLRFVG
ncbi:MAG TPA: TIGR03118 family protein [Steroidobacteraceae bacterium]|nr:TIGR03118 family protein [Steroidobacteraceae bacterium]